MADNAFQWAAACKLVRVNDMHKVEEAKLVLEETFAVENETGDRSEIAGSAELEAYPKPART